jgi:dihydroorotate dehydrogenase (NAD+) catalytic subunit
MINMKIDISGVEFKNPIILSSGPLTTSKAGLLGAERNGFGGVVTKSATQTAAEGNPLPHHAFGKGYLVHSEGLPNKGYKAVAKDIKEVKDAGIGIPIIGSAAGASPEEFAEISVEFEKQGADAVELNLGCPHWGTMVGRPMEEHLGRYWSETPERSFMVVRAVKEAVKIPVWVKVPSERFYSNAEIILAMEKAGVNALVPSVVLPGGMAIDLETGKPILGNSTGTGSVSGRAMKPLGIKCLSEMAKVVRTPIIATGGVFSGLDVIEYAMVGAHAVEVLTAIMQKQSVHDMIRDIESFMSEKGYNSLHDFRGKALQFIGQG